MEHNTEIGPIDRRIIQRYVDEWGYDAVKKRIDEHEFECTILLPGENGNIVPLIEKDAFKIEFVCKNKNNSKLTKNIFSKIASNQKIDVCTTWKPTDKPAIVEIITKFYNKEALLTTLDTIHSRKIKNSQSKLMNISHRADQHAVWRVKDNSILVMQNPMYHGEKKIDHQQEPMYSQNMVVPDFLEVDDSKVDDDIYSILEESPDANRCLTCMSILCLLGYAFGITQTIG